MVRVASDENIIFKRTREIWLETPNIKAKQVCNMLKDLGVTYKTHGQTINNYLSKLRHNYVFGSPQKPHSRLSRTSECFIERKWLADALGVEVRGDGGFDFYEGLGWRLVANRNQVFKYDDPLDRGHIHWYKGGRVIVYLRGPRSWGVTKQMFCDAFHFLPDAVLLKSAEALKEFKKHWVFPVGGPVPEFDIRTFEKSHGLRLFADKSHLYSVEAEETVPFWIDEQQETLNKFNEALGKLAVNIEKHLELTQNVIKLSELRLRRARSVRRKPRKPKRFLDGFFGIFKKR